jgi:hypothetical protein
MTARRWVRRSLQRGATGIALGRLATIYFAFGLLKHALPLTRLARWTWRTPRRARDRTAEHRLLARVVRLQRLLGAVDRDCLQRSLLLYRELSRGGADPVLVAGFRRTEGRLQGHAWVVADGAVVAEPEPEGAQFVPAFGFGRRGAMVLNPGRSRG